MSEFKEGNKIFFKESEKGDMMTDNQKRAQMGYSILGFLENMCEVVKIDENIFTIEDEEETQTTFKISECKKFRLATDAEIKEHQLKSLFTPK